MRTNPPPLAAFPAAMIQINRIFFFQAALCALPDRQNAASGSSDDLLVHKWAFRRHDS
jgi:hypothetical protein